VAGVSGSSVEVFLVEACLRDGTGGSPTAVVRSEGRLSDVDCARIPLLMDTSHVAVIETDVSPSLRFFTAEGELPNCGHGTVAAIAVLALDGSGKGFQGLLSVAGRDLEAVGRVEPGAGGDLVEVWFDQGLVEHRGATEDEQAAFLAALGLVGGAMHPDDAVVVASPGRERLLIPVVDRTVLAGLCPDQQRLAIESHRYGQLGCFVYVPPSGIHSAAARMFAPAIGVPEDVANANSSGCLAAQFLATGRNPTIAVDQGDALGRPSTVHATAIRTERGITAKVGGTARIRSVSDLIYERLGAQREP
jgi:trans-2,3-dihydro-3-hydroxyanthranilate isomerase